jgi:tetratricopeptide (TPR) repeat protein
MISCNRALELNPNHAFAEGLMGLIHAHRGNYDDANRHIDTAIRLSPRDPTLVWVRLTPVIAALIAEMPDEYLAKAKEFTDGAPDVVAGWRHVAAAYVMLDRLDEAREGISQVLKVSPDDCLERVRASIPIANPDVREHFLGYLAKAGLPE